jgi:hypothetical protein
MAGFFWLLVAFVAYVYIGYPLGLHLWRRLWPRPLAANGMADRTPGVSIVIAARNEGRRLAGRIDNLLDLDYPAARRQIIIVSDGSTDDSLQVLARYEPTVERGDCCGRQSPRAQRRRRARAFGLLVFADARQAFASDALRALVAPFADPQVGAVSGELVLEGETRDRRTLTSDRRGRIIRPIAAALERRAGQSPSLDAVDDCRRRRAGWRHEKADPSRRIRHRLDDGRHGSDVCDAAVALAAAAGGHDPRRRACADEVCAGGLAWCSTIGRAPTIAPRATRKTRSGGSGGRWRATTSCSGSNPRFSCPGAIRRGSSSSRTRWRGSPSRMRCRRSGCSLVLLSRRSMVYAAAFAAQCLFYLLATAGAWLEKHEAGTTRRSAGPPVAVPERLARVALMVLVMNASAVAGLAALLTRQKVWR